MSPDILQSVFALTPFLGDITRFFEIGRRFKNLSASRRRSFCGSSNRLLGSMLVMFLRASRWQVEARCFFIGKPNFANEHKVSVSTYFRFTSCRKCPPSMCDRMLWLALFTERRLDQPIITSRGAISDAISDHVGKNRAKQEITSDCLTSACQLKHLFQQATSSKSTNSLCPFISLNKTRKWLFVFENILKTVFTMSIHYILFQLQAFGSQFF